MHQTDTELLYKVYRNVNEAAAEIDTATNMKHKIKTEPDLDIVGSIFIYSNKATKNFQRKEMEIALQLQRRMNNVFSNIKQCEMLLIPLKTQLQIFSKIYTKKWDHPLY